LESGNYEIIRQNMFKLDILERQVIYVGAFIAEELWETIVFRAPGCMHVTALGFECLASLISIELEGWLVHL